MTNEEGQSGSTPRRRGLWIAGAVAVVIAAILVIGISTGWGRGTDAGRSESTPSPTTSGSAEETPSPSASESSDPAAPGSPDPAAPRTTAPPVALDQTAAPAEGVLVSLSSITAIAGEASVPGEVAGPALEITVNVENTASEALEDTLIVNVYYGAQRTPANILVRPRQDLPLSIAPGESAKGIYAFSVPEEARGQVVVEVDLAVDLPVVLFEGAVS